MADRVLILGASARAAAASARRAGYEPFVIDLFADRDTQQLAECWLCPWEEYPHGLFRRARQVPPMPWFYTGGLENEPDLIDALAQERELWGNGSATLRQVRNPFTLSALWSEQGIAHPALRNPGTSPTPSGSWLRKPLRGSGGAGIRFATSAELDDPGAGHFLQQFLPGKSGSTLFWGSDSGAVVCGFSTQLVGTDWLHAQPFQYAGSLTHLADPSSDVIRGASSLVAACGIRGLFGIDCIQQADRSFLLEVNPRYTASVEVIELATGQACLRGTAFPPPNAGSPALGSRMIGKAIYYAPHRLVVPASGPWEESLRHVTDVWRRPDFADIPHPGTRIAPGQPVLTLLAEAESAAACLAQLRARAAECDQLFQQSFVSGESECRP
ncbi:MAG: ATP-grasp domain-containing protein [Bacteroidales bacterium]|nr:ATP-grasp domain-containing protein [Bacteroidales bacterium]